MHIADTLPQLAVTAIAARTHIDSLSHRSFDVPSDLALQPMPTEANPLVAQRPIHVRPFEPGDAPAFLAAVQESVQSVGRWLPWCHAGYTLEDAKAWMTSCHTFWEGGLGYNFAVVDEHTGEFLGSVGIDRIDLEHLNANVGYWVKQSCAGQGIASAAVDLILPFAFFELRLFRLELVALRENRASIRVAEKLGARFESIARHRVTLWDRPHDAVVFSLLPNDIWPAPLEGAGPSVEGSYETS